MYNNVILYYAFNNRHQVVDYYATTNEKIGAWYIRKTIATMLSHRSDICRIYLIDNRPGLKHDYDDSRNEHRRFDEWYAFEDEVSREGVLLWRDPAVEEGLSCGITTI